MIFVIAFLPLFTMRGVEGAIFSPMSHTYAFALTTAILLAAMLTPVLASLVLKQDMRESPNPLRDGIKALYHRLFVGTLNWPRLTLTVMVLIVASALSLFSHLGGEFLPKLEEGNIWVRATHAAEHFAARRRPARQPHEARATQLSGSRTRRFPGRDGPTAAPMPRDFLT